MRRPAPAPPRDAGFVLIYVAAILVFLTSLVMQASHDTRNLAQLSARLQEQAVARQRLQVGAALLRARSDYLWRQAQPSERQLALFSSAALAPLLIDGVAVATSLTDADLRPDVNHLGLEEWQRLLGVYGLDEAQAAKLAASIDAARQRSGGFASIADVADLPGLPSTLLRGFDGGAGEAYPALVDLLTAGGASKRVQVRNSPLPLFAALLRASPAQMARFQEMRRTRSVTVDDAVEVFGAEVRPVCYDGAPERLRVRLTMDTVPLALEFELSVKQGQLQMPPPNWLVLGG